MNSKPQERIILDVGTWEKIFQELMQQVKPRARWTLKLDETLQPDCVAQGWKQYQQPAFGSFRCSSCKRNWASAQVKILCHMHLEQRKSQGQVLMRLFGQRCQKCSRRQFEKPEFSSDSTMRILNNLVQRIREKYYGDGTKKYSETPVIPEVPLEGSHDTANCEACVLGFCVQSLQNCTRTPSKSPFSYMEMGSSLPHIGDVCGQNQARNQPAGAKGAQGSGCSSERKVSGPSQATAGTQVPGAGPQPKQETGQQPTPRAARQAVRGTESQPTQVAGSLPSGWTDLQPTRAVGPLPSAGADSQSTLGTGQQTRQRIYSQALRRSGQQSKQETGSQATPGTGLQAIKGTDLQPTRAVGPLPSAGADSQSTLGTGQQTRQRIYSQALRRSGQQSKQETGSQATPGTGLQAIKGTDLQPTRAVGPLPSAGADSQSTLGTGQQTRQRIYSQALRRSGQQSKQETGSQATPGTGLQAIKGTDPQPTRRASSTDTHGSGSFRGTQASWESQDRYSHRVAVPDSSSSYFFSMEPNNSSGLGNLLKLGCAICVAALYALVVGRHFR